MAVHSIELCAGVGMLGEGVRAGFEFLGFEHRTICYVEREAPAAAQLATLMEAGVIDPAPVWSDMLTFDGGQWRGKVDCVIAGFPCQDLSVAGRRAGLGGERSGLFFRVCDIADDCGARILVLENVRGITSATATVVGEAGDEWEERAASRVMGELADRGWNAEWIHVSASDVGGSHGRERWFCLAWRELADAGDTGESGRSRSVQKTNGEVPERNNGAEPCDTGQSVADPQRTERRPQCARRVGGIKGNNGGRPETDGRTGVAGEALAHPQDDNGRRRERAEKAGTGPGGVGRRRSSGGSAAVANTSIDGRREGRTKPERQQGRSDVVERDGSVADPGSQGQQGREQRGTCSSDRGGQEAHGSTSEFCSALPLFAPGPTDERWPAIIERFPGLAPATEPGVRMLVDELALVVDESRNHQLRAIGNGVVPLSAAAALVLLVRRSRLA